MVLPKFTSRQDSNFDLGVDLSWSDADDYAQGMEVFWGDGHSSYIYDAQGTESHNYLDYGTYNLYVVPRDDEDVKIYIAKVTIAPFVPDVRLLKSSVYTMSVGIYVTHISSSGLTIDWGDKTSQHLGRADQGEHWHTYVYPLPREIKVLYKDGSVAAQFQFTPTPPTQAAQVTYSITSDTEAQFTFTNVPESGVVIHYGDGNSLLIREDKTVPHQYSHAGLYKVQVHPGPAYTPFGIDLFRQVLPVGNDLPALSYKTHPVYTANAQFTVTQPASGKPLDGPFYVYTGWYGSDRVHDICFQYDPNDTNGNWWVFNAGTYTVGLYTADLFHVGDISVTVVDPDPSKIMAFTHTVDGLTLTLNYVRVPEGGAKIYWADYDHQEGPPPSIVAETDEGTISVTYQEPDVKDVHIDSAKYTHMHLTGEHIPVGMQDRAE